MSLPEIYPEKSKIPYIPIEVFKNPKSQYYPVCRNCVKTFTSSGTTSANKSIVQFSQAGLEQYRTNSLKTFVNVLEDSSSKTMSEFIGISLISTIQRAPQSSLSQMLHYFSEEYNVVYCSVGELSSCIKRIKQKYSNKSIWIFSTAISLNDYLKIHTHEKLQLPKESKIFETGGTKGLINNFTRTDFYAHLALRFSLSTEDIISEYSMSELACQAYDWVPYKARQANYSRYYRFDCNVKIKALTGINRVTPNGIGALLIDDESRIGTIGPIRTQDLVEIKNQKFRFLKRLKVAPLKGCSLDYEVGESVVTNRLKLKRTDDVKLVAIKDIDVFFANLLSYLKSEFCLEKLEEDLRSTNLAKIIIDDVLCGIPNSAKELVNAAKNAVSNSNKKNWLYLFSGTHPLVALQPLILGLLNNFKIYIRANRNYNSEFISAFVQFLNLQSQIKISYIPNKILLPIANPPWEAQLCFGSDETISYLQRNTKEKLVAYGDRNGISIISELSSDAARKVALDAFSLNQGSCLASKALVIIGNYCKNAIREFLLEVHKSSQILLQEYYDSLSAADILEINIGFEHQQWHFTDRSELLDYGLNSTTKPLVYTPVMNYPSKVQESNYQFVLQSILVKDISSLLESDYVKNLGLEKTGLITYFGEESKEIVTAIQQDSSLNYIACRDLGDAQKLPLNGHYEGKPLLGIIK